MNSAIKLRRPITACLVAAVAWATPPSAGAVDWEGLQPVPDTRLATLRGGFETALGLRLSFSLERVVYVNGELMATTRLTIPDLGNLSARGASVSTTGGLPAGSSLPTGASQLITNGQVVQLPSSSAIITGIQNSLNNQLIQVRTTIDATLASTSQMRGQLFSDAFRQSAVDSIRR